MDRIQIDTNNPLLISAKQHPIVERMMGLARMGLWRWEIGKQSIDFSDPLYQLFDIQPGQFKPTVSSLSDIIPQRDLAKLFINFKKMLNSGLETVTALSFTHPECDRNYWVKCYASCEVDESGGVKALYGLIQDVTHDRERQESLRRALNKAETANQAKAGFLATMSHELRTPLNAIIGFSEMMNGEILGPLGNRRYTEYCKNIHQSGRHLLGLINDILDMSKIEAGRYELNYEPVNVGKAVRHAIEIIQGRADDSELSLYLDQSIDVGVVEADRRGFMQMLMNVLDNAVKYTPEGGKIIITGQRTQLASTITIQDSGIGIEPDKLELITQPFVQAENAMTRLHDGAGLGLAITKKLIDYHNGSLNIESRRGHGTAVSITIPVRTANSAFTQNMLQSLGGDRPKRRRIA